MRDPEALVLDEPCTGLDPEGMFYVRRSMRALAQAGKSIVLVTHYPEDVIPEITRLVLVKDGAVFADGPKEHLLSDDTMSALFGGPRPREKCRRGCLFLACERLLAVVYYVAAARPRPARACMFRTSGEMTERPKVHDWKSCVRQKRT